MNTKSTSEIEWNYMLLCFPVGDISAEAKGVISDKIKKCLIRGINAVIHGYYAGYMIKWLPNTLVPGGSFCQRVHLNDTGVQAWTWRKDISN